MNFTSLSHMSHTVTEFWQGKGRRLQHNYCVLQFLPSLSPSITYAAHLT